MAIKSSGNVRKIKGKDFLKSDMNSLYKAKQLILVLAALVSRNFLKIFYVFSIEEKKNFFCSHHGKLYICNPNYISMYFKSKSENKFKYVWVFNKPREFLRMEDSETIVLKINSLKFFYHFLTAKFIIINSSNFPYIPKRRKQIIINTWHGGGAYKKIGQENNLDMYKKITICDFSYMVSSCRKFTNVMSKAFTKNDENKFLNIGMPRNDIFFRNYQDIIQRTLDKLQLSESKKYILCAPTWRLEQEDYDLNFQQLLEICKRKFGGEWVVLFRSHKYHKINTLKKLINEEYVIDVSEYDDMQELICISNILITDYSSCMWDMLLTRKPCFIYAQDIERYTRCNGFYVPPSAWPFLIAKNNEELEHNIMHFKDDIYREKIKMHCKDLGCFENGNATKAIYDFLKEKLINKGTN